MNDRFERRAPAASAISDPDVVGRLSVGFGFLGAIVTFMVMRAMGTASLDPLAFHVGVGAAAPLGALAAWAVQRLRAHPRARRLRWVLVPLAGAIVGMLVQAVLLRVPATYTWPTTGLTKTQPICWVLAGLPLGSVPATVLAMLLYASLRATGRIAAFDTRERMLVPIAGICLIAGGDVLLHASKVEAPAIAVVLLLAAATLVEALAHDLLRARWLAQAFAGEGGLAVVPSAELPLEGALPSFVGGAPRDAVIVRIPRETGYRAAARTPVAATAADRRLALRPLRWRRVLVGGFFVAAVAQTVIGLAR